MTCGGSFSSSWKSRTRSSLGYTPHHTPPSPLAVMASSRFWVAAAQSWAQYCSRVAAFQVAADEDGQRGVRGHLGVGMDLGDPVQQVPVVHHHELPGLLVVRRGRGHGGPHEVLGEVGGDGLGGILADAPPGEDGLHRVHASSS